MSVSIDDAYKALTIISKVCKKMKAVNRAHIKQIVNAE